VDPVALKEEAFRSNLLDAAGNLTPEALGVLEAFETLLVKTKRKVSTEILGNDHLERIREYRELFPATRLPSGELARQSVQELKDKFVWFFKTYPEYAWTQVLDATDYYVYTKSREHYRYMATSSYFILKTDTRTRTSRSLLADHCQLLHENPELLRQTPL